MKCNKCNTEVQSGKFCPNCGTKVEEEQVSSQVSNEQATLSGDFALFGENDKYMCFMLVSYAVYMAFQGVPMLGSLLGLVILGLQFFFVSEDKKILASKGFSSPHLAWALLPVVYMWKRANIVNQKKVYFWIWVIAGGAFVISTIVTVLTTLFAAYASQY